MKKTVLAFTLFAFLAMPARAQFTVIDPANLGEAFAQGLQMTKQLETARRQAQRLRDNLERLRRLEFNSISDAQRTIDGALHSASGLAYTAASMDRQFADIYPDAAGAADRAQKIRQVRQTIGTMRGTLRQLGRAAAKVEATSRDLGAFKRQIKSIADTPQKARQVQSALQVYQAQQNALMHQTLQTMAAQQATMNAYKLQQRRERIMRGQKAIQNMKRIKDPQTEGFDGNWSFTD